ncbi:flagellar biosynthesis protein FliQ [Calycomorphotria hydatis]|uniref:Flagellar biosynthetic protein FliQ n=1 Tax=Calycomorphotria hydatis TaxID=2528027 RepID=A0A517TB99_9PLAN|nr:flagellar biosynthesis protein FliQ [Calycomorphotria hydatis]QDT65635.1 Flagellar biosynthetic protein FliQ [Calycomorphotria hydatis]
MTIEQAVELARDAMILTLMLGLPVMIAAVVVGLLISILQAVTQLQDQTLSFVPKIVAMLLVMLYTFPWALGQSISYATELFHNIPIIITN